MCHEKTYIIHLYFRNALHVGTARSGAGIEASQGYIHSDTFWAALTNYWALLGSAGGITFKEFLRSFKAGNDFVGVEVNPSPLFTISSAFPFTSKGREYCYWLPKPLSVPFSLSCENSEDSRDRERLLFGKSTKKARFLSHESFSRWQSFIAPVGFEVEKNSYDASSESEVRPQSAVDRISSKSNLFHSGISYLDANNEREGLFVLLRTSDKRVEKALDEILGVIRDAGGIGGDISSGCGELSNYYIEPVAEDDQSWAFLRGFEGANANCLLSLCLPRNPTEISDHLVAFDTVLRKGWTGSLTTNIQRKRKTVYMLSEGTVLTEQETGCMANVTPDNLSTPEWQGLHEVYRYGYGFSVPIRINLED